MLTASRSQVGSEPPGSPENRSDQHARVRVPLETGVDRASVAAGNTIEALQPRSSVSRGESGASLPSAASLARPNKYDDYQHSGVPEHSYVSLFFYGSGSKSLLEWRTCQEQRSTGDDDV